jgi:CheY-like chemotaxis protein
MNTETRSILVADDNSDTREALSLCLRMSGHHVTCVADGKQAIDALAHDQFDLVITDLLMPYADGFEVIMATGRSQPNAGVIAMSGGGEYLGATDLLNTGRLLGADAHLQKPFSREQLLEAIENIARYHAVAAA